MEKVLTDYNFERTCNNNVGGLTVKHITVNGKEIVFYQIKGLSEYNHLVVDPIKNTAFLKVKLGDVTKERTERLLQMSKEVIHIGLKMNCRPDMDMYVSEMNFIIDYGRAKSDGGYYVITFKGEVK